MRNARLYGIAGLAVLAAAAVAVAQTTVTPLPESAPAETAPIAAPAADAVAELAKTHWGDAQNGAAKAGACAACHGLDGNAMQQGAPRIAGMPERYVARQLALFKSNHRTTGLAPLMKPFADALSAQDMRDVGAHYANQRSGAGVASDVEITDADSAYKGQPFFKPGQDLYRTGDAKRDIPACFACHGPSGSGNPGPAYPHLGGQDAAYVTRRLQEYRAGKTTEPNPHQFKQMAVIAKHLSDEEIQSLANYLQGLHASADNATPAQIAAVRASGTLPAAPGLPAPIGAPQPVAAPAAAAPATEAAPAAEAPAAAPTH
ncbi:cytochrome C [Lysobacter oculi]|uniref:Cytochrome C n=1 Tax=Solilutibacter oculi TaxID=2698682 RepID=A0A344J724_9GAMM|nr:c-type cytochrome [Lysobacter oculi]AXA84834.1 cytochrome C [Lysobacter oculi]